MISVAEDSGARRATPYFDITTRLYPVTYDSIRARHFSLGAHDEADDADYRPAINDELAEA